MWRDIKATVNDDPSAEALAELSEFMENLKYEDFDDNVFEEMKYAIREYMDKSHNWDFEELANGAIDDDEIILDSEEAGELAKQEIDHGGLYRLHFFLRGCDVLNNNYFFRNVYGNLETATKHHLDKYRDAILEAIDEAYDEQ